MFNFEPEYDVVVTILEASNAFLLDFTEAPEFDPSSLQSCIEVVQNTERQYRVRCFQNYSVNSIAEQFCRTLERQYNLSVSRVDSLGIEYTSFDKEQL